MREGEPREGEPPVSATRPGETRHGETPKALTPSRYLAWLYSTDAQKPVLAALLEIESEIASGLRPGIEHHVAHARLQWWSEEAERAAERRPVHPLTRALVKARANASGNASHGGSHSSSDAGSHTGSHADGAASAATHRTVDLMGFVDTAVWDLASATFETRKELTAYCERWAAAMFETAAGPAVSNGTRTMADPASNSAYAAGRGLASDAASTAVGTPPSPWKVLGAAVREVELLADAARDAHVGRVRIPLDELDRAGVDAKALTKLPWPAPLAALLKERHEALRTTLAKNVAALAREEQMALRGLLVWVALTWRLSARTQRALPNVILPHRYDALAGGWQAWRAARRAATGRLRFG